MITQKRLIELLNYDPYSGLFTWRITPKGGKRKAGDVAGYKQKIGYIRIVVDGYESRAHRLAFLYLTGWMPEEVDHINHCRSDNRWANLRCATRKSNTRNQPLRKDNKSGCPGVYMQNRKWIAGIFVDGEYFYLGRHVDKREAIKAKKKAEKQHGFHKNHGVDDVIAAI